MKMTQSKKKTVAKKKTVTKKKTKKITLAKAKRTQVHITKMSTKVQSDITQIAKDKGLAKWFVTETLLIAAMSGKAFNVKAWVN